MSKDEIYVNSDAMIGFKEEMNLINTECVNDIESINGYINTLTESYFKGDYADSFKDSISQFATTVKNGHESMASVDNFLDSVVEVMNKE